MRNNFASDECFNTTFFQQRDLLSISQIGICLVFDDASLALDCCLKQATQRVWLGTFLINLLDNWRCFLVALGGLLEPLDLHWSIGAVRVNALEPKRPFDGHFPIAKSGVWKYF